MVVVQPLVAPIVMVEEREGCPRETVAWIACGDNVTDTAVLSNEAIAAVPMGRWPNTVYLAEFSSSFVTANSRGGRLAFISAFIVAMIVVNVAFIVTGRISVKSVPRI